MSRIDTFAQRSGMPPLLVRFWVWIAVSSLLSILFTGGMIVILHNKFAYGVLVLLRDGDWWDFWAFQPRFEHFRTPAFWNTVDYPFTYPPVMAIVFAALYNIPHALRLYLLLCLAMFAGWAWFVAREISARCGSSRWITLAFTASIPITAWPVYLLLTSGNVEGLVAIALAGGVWAVLRGRWWLGAALIGVAGSMKIFPLALLALLLSRRRYKEFAAALVLAAGLTWASLVMVGPTVSEAARHIADGLTFVKYVYALSVTQYAPDVSHSLFSPIKFSIVVLYRWLHPATWHAGQTAVLELIYRLYMPIVCIAGPLVWLVRIRRMPMLNQVFALTVMAILLPPFSVDYTLVQLFLPLGLFLVYTAERWRGGIDVKGMKAVYMCFAILYPIGTFFTIKYRFGSLIRSFALTALFVVLLRFPFPWAELDEHAGEPG